MREKIAEGEINYPLRNLLQDESVMETRIHKLLENINCYFDERFNEEDKTLKYTRKESKICDELSNIPIMNWTKDNIRQWADKLKKEIRLRQIYFDWKNEYRAEIISVIVRAVKFYRSYSPRNTQLIALAIFVDPTGSKKGRLDNISTGEGKSLITAMLATAQALIGEKFDIVTSSKVLAIRDASDDSREGYRKFFELFGLKAGNNCDEACDATGTGDKERKERYEQNDIIYGETGYFQRDILLTNFFNKNIRDCIGNSLIVDEVDNMVIDNAEKTLYISHSITDIRYL
ncbi:unnamed protein product [Rotaria sp. Silwood1]|nr:unnamed protein product [Rotaria sp. Silwood1]